jgi:Chorismate mutase
MTDTKELREMIRSIDQEIIELIATRMEIADELALAKRSSSQEFWDVKVEKEIIERYKKLCEEVALSEDEAEKIAVLILNISRERQRHFFE